ncbi:MAG: ABC transporter ATP-binding protein [Candidatus Eisenbacteria bacterium]|nr:ABC transporter ATP-binding protein [Candidatus Eisenbacteria bacterium]
MNSPAIGGRLTATDISFAYHPGAAVLNGATLDIPAGAFLGIVGPNGAGKSTLLHLLSGALKPSAGGVRLDDTPLQNWKRRDIARCIAVVPQAEPHTFPYRVSEIVMMGRTPWLSGLLSAETANDHAAVRRAMTAVGIKDLACRPLGQLSGGERQMVLVARALAQEPKILLLDEPTASLDLAHQQSIFRLLVRLNEETGLTVVIVTHDLNLAGLYCRTLAVLHGKRIEALGTPAEVLTPARLESVYGAALWGATSPAGAPIVGLTR